MQTLTKCYNPQDPQYKANRLHILRELSTQSESDLKAQLDFLASQPPPVDEQNVAGHMLNNIRGMNLPPRIKGILDTTSGTTGNVLIRQDLEPILHRLFVTVFPLWETIAKGPSNGLTLLAPAC